MSKKKITKAWQAVPLKGSFMVISILGFLLSYYYIYQASPDFGIASMIIFSLMFIAALVSMSKAPLMGVKEKK
tara:strand:- start:1321 stop:1539 length:219 start_codon:yes stop_codon:yes gene_type:complete